MAPIAAEARTLLLYSLFTNCTEIQVKLRICFHGMDFSIGILSGNSPMVRYTGEDNSGQSHLKELHHEKNFRFSSYLLNFGD